MYDIYYGTSTLSAIWFGDTCHKTTNPHEASAIAQTLARLGYLVINGYGEICSEL